MHWLYRGWWRFLMDLRPMVRFLAERFPELAPWMVRLRAVLHLLVGNPIQTLAAVDGLVLWRWVGWPGRWLLLAFVAACGLVEVHHRVCYRSGDWLIAWREAWRFRRRWPGEWAIVAAKTARVQAEVGTSKEPIASAVLRPVADHPKMSWWPRLEWPVVSWWVGPPPGRSLLALDELSVILAANISRAADILVDYERENDSARPAHRLLRPRSWPTTSTSPTWATAHGDQGDNDPDDELATALDEFEEDQAEGEPVALRLPSTGSAELMSGLDIGRRFDARPLLLPWPPLPPHPDRRRNRLREIRSLINALIGCPGGDGQHSDLRYRLETRRTVARGRDASHRPGRHAGRGGSTARSTCPHT